MRCTFFCVCISFWWSTMEERGSLKLTWAPSSHAWEDALMLYWGSLCLWAAVMFRHEQNWLVREPALMGQHGTHGCATGFPMEPPLSVVLSASPGLPDERHILFQGMWWLQVLWGWQVWWGVILSTWTYSVCGSKSLTFPPKPAAGRTAWFSTASHAGPEPSPSRKVICPQVRLYFASEVYIKNGFLAAL